MFRARVSLSDFCEHLLPSARRAGYKMVLVAVVRHADAPEFFDDIVRDWSSLHDATGPDILFVFAGENVTDRLPLTGRHEPALHATDLAAVAGAGHRRDLLARTMDRMPELAYGHPRLDRWNDLAVDHTLEISALRHRLHIRESRLPCLAYFILNTDGYLAPSLTVPLVRFSRMGIYRYLKSLSGLLEDDFREIDGITSAARPVGTQLKQSRGSAGQLRGSIRTAATALPSPAARDAVEEILTATQASMDQPGAREQCYRNLRAVMADHPGPHRRAGSPDGLGALVPNLQRLIDLSLRGKGGLDVDHDALALRLAELTRAEDAAWAGLDQRLRSLHQSDSELLPEDDLAAEPPPADDVETAPGRNRRRLWSWAGRFASAVALCGLAAYLFAVGLENADKVASVIGVFIALIGLVLPYLFRDRRSQT